MLKFGVRYVPVCFLRSKPIKCPICGVAELIHDTSNLPHTHKGETNTIPTVTGDFCPACGEVVLNCEHGDRYSELVGLSQRQVNAAYVAKASKK